MAYEHPGFMFMCTKATEIDCLGRKLLGLPKGSYKDMLAIGPYSHLFLFNFQTKFVHGVFYANGKPGLQIDPTAWQCAHPRTFPAQVRYIHSELTGTSATRSLSFTPRSGPLTQRQVDELYALLEKDQPLTPVSRSGGGGAGNGSGNGGGSVRKPAIPTAIPERRVDPSDGCSYTRSEFVAFYGGCVEWDKARTPGTRSLKCAWGGARVSRTVDVASGQRESARIPLSSPSSSQPPPAAAGAAKSSVPMLPNYAPGWVALVENTTIHETLAQSILGEDVSRLPLMQSAIGKNTLIFLHNIDDDRLYGIFSAQGPARKDLEPGFLKGHFKAQVRLKALSEISDVHLDTLPFKLQPGRMSVELTEEVKLRMERAATDVKKKAAMAEVSGMKWECCDCTFHNENSHLVCGLCGSQRPSAPVWIQDEESPKTAEIQQPEASLVKILQENEISEQVCKELYAAGVLTESVFMTMSEDNFTAIGLKKGPRLRLAKWIQKKREKVLSAANDGNSTIGFITDDDDGEEIIFGTLDPADEPSLPVSMDNAEVKAVLAELGLPENTHSILNEMGDLRMEDLLTISDEVMAAIGLRKGPRMKILTWQKEQAAGQIGSESSSSASSSSYRSEGPTSHVSNSVAPGYFAKATHEIAEKDTAPSGGDCGTEGVDGDSTASLAPLKKLDNTLVLLLEQLQAQAAAPALYMAGVVSIDAMKRITDRDMADMGIKKGSRVKIVRWVTENRPSDWKDASDGAGEGSAKLECDGSQQGVGEFREEIAPSESESSRGGQTVIEVGAGGGEFVLRPSAPVFEPEITPFRPENLQSIEMAPPSAVSLASVGNTPQPDLLPSPPPVAEPPRVLDPYFDTLEEALDFLGLSEVHPILCEVGIRHISDLNVEDPEALLLRSTSLPNKKRRKLGRWILRNKDRYPRKWLCSLAEDEWNEQQAGREQTIGAGKGSAVEQPCPPSMPLSSSEDILEETSEGRSSTSDTLIQEAPRRHIRLTSFAAKIIVDILDFGSEVVEALEARSFVRVRDLITEETMKVLRDAGVRKGPAVRVRTLAIEHMDRGLVDEAAEDAEIAAAESITVCVSGESHPVESIDGREEEANTEEAKAATNEYVLPQGDTTSSSNVVVEDGQDAHGTEAVAVADTAVSPGSAPAASTPLLRISSASLEVLKSVKLMEFVSVLASNFSSFVRVSDLVSDAVIQVLKEGGAKKGLLIRMKKEALLMMKSDEFDERAEVAEAAAFDASTSAVSSNSTGEVDTPSESPSQVSSMAQTVLESAALDEFVPMLAAKFGFVRVSDLVSEAVIQILKEGGAKKGQMIRLRKGALLMMESETFDEGAEAE